MSQNHTARPISAAENAARLERLERESEDLIRRMQLGQCDCDSLHLHVVAVAEALKDCQQRIGGLQDDIAKSVAENSWLRKRMSILEGNLKSAQDSVKLLSGIVRVRDNTIAAQADSLLALGLLKDSLARQLESTTAELGKKIEIAMLQSIEFYIITNYRKNDREIILKDGEVVSRREMRKAGDDIYARITIHGLNARFKMFYNFKIEEPPPRRRTELVAPKAMPDEDNEEPIYLSDLPKERKAVLRKRVSGIDRFPKGRITINYDLDLLSRRTDDGRLILAKENKTMQDVEGSISFTVR